MELKNRICMAAMGQRFNTKPDGSLSDDHNPTQDLIDYYTRRAAGGVGLVILEMTEAAPDSAIFRPSNLALHEDQLIPGMSRLASAVHTYDAKVAPQLHIYGNVEIQTRWGPQFGGRPILRPGGPMELSEEQIWHRIDEYGQATRRARDAGFDCVEFHGCHQHSIAAQFSSSHMNKRTDGWGGSVQNRARFAQEVIRRCKQTAGNDFPLIWRFSAEEYVEDGMTLEEAKIFARLIEEAGADALHVSAGTMETPEYTCLSNLLPVGYLVPLAAAIKEKVKIPVITVGRITSPKLAESILQKGQADLIALARPLLADPDWARKGLEGRHQTIRVCLSCNICFDFRDNRIGRCLLNPELGRKREFALESTKAIERKKVVVIGGGPAGLEAARVAQSTGHQVTVFEEKETLGGHWSWLIKSYVVRKQRELEKLGVRLELGQKVTSSLVEQLNPDVVVVTDEATPVVPQIPGMKQENVFVADDVLLGKVELAGRVIILGGAAAGCRTAMYLREKGLAVTVVEKGSHVGREYFVEIWPILTEKMADKGIEMLTKHEATALEGNYLTCVDRDGKQKVLQADNVVIALGYQTKQDLADSLRGRVAELYSVVHCEAPRDVLVAAEDGAAVARNI